MQGLELSRRFYRDLVRPWLDRAFPGLGHAAALIGSGSELLGFDDAMSADHNWGPRVWLVLSEPDFAARAGAIVSAFAAVAPAAFIGAPIGFASRPNPASNGPGARGDDRHGLEVWTLEAILRERLDLARDEPGDAVGWLGLSEQRLLGFTAGAVFHDDDGRLSAQRARLASFPDAVWRYKLACQWTRIAEEQAFVGRTGLVGDDLGSRVIAARLARDVMRLGFLIERTYAPYPKWFGSAFAKLSCAGALAPPLARALAARDWRTREVALAEAYLAAARLQWRADPAPALEPRLGAYFDRPFTVINAAEIAAAVRAGIDDPSLKALPLIGSLDQVTDATPVIEAPGRSGRAMRALLEGGA